MTQQAIVPQVLPPMPLANHLSTAELWHPALFDVTARPVYLDDGSLIPGRKAIVRSDTGDVLSVMTDSYVPVSNAQVIHGFTEIANAANLKFNFGKAHLIRGGAKTMIEINFPELMWEVRGGDILHMRAHLINGFDGFSAAGLDAGFWRLICSNGAYIGEKEMSIRYIHMGQVNQNLIKQFKEYLTLRLNSTKQYVQKLSESKFPDRDAVSTIFEEAEPWLGKKYAAELSPEWERQKQALSAWVIYNVFTWVISHQVQAGFERKVTMWKKLSNESRNWRIS